MCFEFRHTEKPKQEVKLTPVPASISAVPVHFKTGDKVKITRKAATNENEWQNSWVNEMDKGIGKTGTVSADYGKQGVSVIVSGMANWSYPSFVLELVQDKPVQVETTLKIGDTVRAPGRDVFDTLCVVPKIDKEFVFIRTPKGDEGGFYPKNLKLEAATKFKRGDKVKVNWNYGSIWDGTAVVRSVFSNGDVSVTMDNGGYQGAFSPNKLTLIKSSVVVHSAPEIAAKERGISGAAKSHSKVFAIAKNLAVEIARRNAGHVNADLVQKELVGLGFSSTDLGNAAGVLFRGKNWKKVSTVKSNRKGNHLREITNWQYVEN